MLNSSFIELFRNLNKKELRDLKKIVRSPFHNKRQDVVDLFDYLNKNHPFEQPEKLKKERIFKLIYPNQIFDRQQFYYLCSFLKKIIEDYLIYTNVKASALDSNIRLSNIYRNRGLDKQFEEAALRVKQNLKTTAFRNSEYHYQNFRFHTERIEFSGSKSRTNSGNFRESAEALNIYFIGQKLKQSCLGLSHQLFSTVQLEEGFLKEILKFTEQKNYQNTEPVVEVYFHFYKAFTTEDPEFSFQKLKSLIAKHQGNFPKKEMRDIYLMTVNYGIKQFNSGKREYLKEVFDLYQQGLEFEVFIENQTISRFTYGNIVLAGLGLKEFDQTEKFIYDYRQFLEPKFRENTFQYNLANLYFQKPDYPKAMDLLQTVEFDDLLYNIESRRMLLKIYFTMNETTSLYSLLDSFKRFIYRQKELGYHKESYLNLIRFTSRLLGLNFSKKEVVRKLKNEIETTQRVADKKWLLEQF